jgi:hypothetical protein
MTDVGALDQLGRDLLSTVFPRAEDSRARRAGGRSIALHAGVPRNVLIHVEFGRRGLLYAAF